MKNSTYDKLKYIALIVLPASATLVEAVTGIWSLPYGPQIATTINAVATFLGAILVVSSNNYRKKVEEGK